ncbi:MAG: carbohydrate ABC transporter permease [Lachnospiraceae bacterium]|nr:carbohydrate ABC transporter permease [Lachnospiraceae bacterium]
MNHKEKKSTKIIRFIICALIVLIYFMPIYLLGNVSVREATDFSSKLWPTQNPTLEKYITILTDPMVWKSFANTLLYAALEILFLIPTAAMGGYALSRSAGRLSNMIRTFNILVMMIPGTALLVGTYSLMVNLHLTNSIFGIALYGAGASMTGSMFFYTTFSTSIPTELDEAAELDGAGPVKTFFYVIMPLMKGITVTRVISVVIGCWNSYLMPLYLLTKSEKYTILLYVRKLFTNSVIQDVPLSFAAGAVMVIPIVVFYFVMQKYIVGGQIDSSVKG